MVSVNCCHQKCCLTNHPKSQCLQAANFSSQGYGLAAWSFCSEPGCADLRWARLCAAGQLEDNCLRMVSRAWWVVSCLFSRGWHDWITSLILPQATPGIVARDLREKWYSRALEVRLGTGKPFLCPILPVEISQTGPGSRARKHFTSGLDKLKNHIAVSMHTGRGRKSGPYIFFF